MAKTFEHSFTGRILHWVYCRHCGMVLLNNEASRKRARKPCWVDKE